SRIHRKEPPFHIMRADQRLTMVEQIPITFLAKLHLFLELPGLRDADHVDDHRLELASLVEDRMDAVHKMLDHSFLVLDRFRPFHYFAGTAGFFEYHASCPCHGGRAAGILAELLIRLADHPLPEMLVGYAEIVR